MTKVQAIEPTLKATKTGNGPAWDKRHNDAVIQPAYGHERALVLLCEGVAEYADAHREEWGPVGADGYCGDYLMDIIKGVNGLLSGPSGSRLDMGTLSTFLNDIARRDYGKDLGEL
jgi:hypothetical protein